jgi:DNA repair exonuclease SbcCD ATPase subunit
MKPLRWLKETQEEGRKLSGILYLHRIDAPRMQGSALRHFGTFKQLCGEGFYKNIMLGTTCWDLVDANTLGQDRETQLKEKGGFWYALLQKDAEIVRIPKERERARDLVFRLASKNPAFLQSQGEMGTMRLSLDEVSANKIINEDLEKLRAENERVRQQEQENFFRLQQQREEKARAQLEEERKRHDQLLREQEEERQRILSMQRDAQARREKEMKELEERMRQVRIKEAKYRKAERKEAQKRLDDQQFSLDYKRLSRDSKYGLIKVNILS